MFQNNIVGNPRGINPCHSVFSDEYATEILYKINLTCMR